MFTKGDEESAMQPLNVDPQRGYQAAGEALLPLPNTGGKKQLSFAEDVDEKHLVVAEGPEASKVTQAVIWAEQARDATCNWVDRCSQNQLEWYMLMKRTQWLTFLAKYGLLFLTVFELPAICTGTQAMCLGGDTPKFYNYHIWRIPPAGANSFALVCWVVLLGRMFVQSKAYGKAFPLDWTGQRNPKNEMGRRFPGWEYDAFSFWHALGLIVIVLGVVTTLTAFLMPQERMFEFVVLLRPLVYICVSRDIRKSIEQISRSIPGYFTIIASLFICVAVFVWIGMVLFFRTGEEGSFDFHSWGDGLAKMWIYFTTSNSPDVFIPSYNKNRAYVIFWVTYFTTTMYLLSNVLLAKVYDEYVAIMKNAYKMERSNRSAALQRTWSLLADETDTIPPKTWEQFFMEYCDPSIGGIKVEDRDVKYNMWRAHVIFDLFFQEKFSGVASPHDGAGSLTRGLTYTEFKSIMKVFFDRDFYIPRRRPPTAYHFLHKLFAPGNYIVDCLCIKFEWDHLVDLVVLLGVVLTFAQTLLFLRKDVSDTLINKPTFWILVVFSLLYASSNIAKLFAFGFERYWYRNAIKNRFETVTIMALIFVEGFYIGFWRNVALERAIIILHIIRGVHLLGYIGPFNHLWVIVRRILPDFWQMIQVLLLVYYFFATLGTMLFGGIIFKGNPGLYGSQFDSSNYYSLNFNDILGGYIILFVLMVVNNWMVIADGYMLATRWYYGHAWYACGFFVSYFVVCNLIVLNILVALILNHPDLGEVGEETGQPMDALHAKHTDAKIRQIFVDDGDMSDDPEPEEKAPKLQKLQSKQTFDEEAPMSPSRGPEALVRRASSKRLETANSSIAMDLGSSYGTLSLPSGAVDDDAVVQRQPTVDRKRSGTGDFLGQPTVDRKRTGTGESFKLERRNSQ